METVLVVAKATQKNWKTSLAGILGFVGVLVLASQAALDGDPLTIPHWDVVASAAVAMVGLFMARDADKSSADSGIE